MNKIQAKVYAITYPNNQRHEIYDVDLDVMDPKQSTTFLRTGSTGRVVEHYILELPSPNDLISIVIPGGVDPLAATVNQALQCHIEAEFQPEQWVNNHAVPLLNDYVTFNALPALSKMALSEVKAMFEQGTDFDALAEGLPAREDHDGPFEVSIEEQHVVAMVCLLSGTTSRLSENDNMADISQWMWDDFCIAARGILAAKQQARPQLSEPTSKLLVDGNTFTFKGNPGEVCAVQAAWGHPPEDEAYRLAHSLMESQLLSLYSAGVIWAPNNGGFHPKLIEAVQTMLDALPRLIEDIEGPVNPQEEISSHERPT